MGISKERTYSQIPCISRKYMSIFGANSTINRFISRQMDLYRNSIISADIMPLIPLCSGLYPHEPISTRTIPFSWDNHPSTGRERPMTEARRTQPLQRLHLLSMPIRSFGRAKTVDVNPGGKCRRIAASNYFCETSEKLEVQTTQTEWIMHVQWNRARVLKYCTEELLLHSQSMAEYSLNLPFRRC
jgi:hypothetical protein